MNEESFDTSTYCLKYQNPDRRFKLRIFLLHLDWIDPWSLKKIDSTRLIITCLCNREKLNQQKSFNKLFIVFGYDIPPWCTFWYNKYLTLVVGGIASYLDLNCIQQLIESLFSIHHLTINEDWFSSKITFQIVHLFRWRENITVSTLWTKNTRKWHMSPHVIRVVYKINAIAVFEQTAKKSSKRCHLQPKSSIGFWQVLQIAHFATTAWQWVIDQPNMVHRSPGIVFPVEWERTTKGKH